MSEDADWQLHCHGAQDYQSWLMHRAAVELLQDNPALKLRLLDTLARWQLRQGPWAQTLCDAWVEISPLATILPNSVRYGIIRQVRALKNKREVPHA